jgi:hypothetical protein
MAPSRSLPLSALLWVLISLLSLGYAHSPVARYTGDRSPLPYVHARQIARNGSEDDGRVLLPTNVRPLLYKLTIEPHFQLTNNSADLAKNGSYSFDAHAAIDIEVLDDTFDIVFNTNRLDIANVTLEQGSETR